MALFIASFLCAEPPSAYSQSDAALIELVRVGNKSSIESIRTFEADVETYSPGDPGLSARGHYWRTSDVAREASFVANDKVDVLTRQGKKYVLHQLDSPPGKLVHARLLPATRDAGACDAWVLGLVQLPSSPRLTLDQLIEASQEPVQIRRLKSDGAGEYQITATCNGDRISVTIDPTHNYLTKAVEIQPGPKTNLQVKAKVIAFAEAAPSFFFPTAIDFSYYSRTGELVHSGSATIKNIRINHSVPPASIQLRFPRGIRMLDELQGIEYEIDENGREIGNRKKVPQVRPPEDGQERTDAMLASSKEPESRMWRIVAGLSVLLLLSVMIIRIVGFRRRVNLPT